MILHSSGRLRADCSLTVTHVFMACIKPVLSATDINGCHDQKRRDRQACYLLAGILEYQEESHAVARKPREAAAVVFGLKFADNIHYKFKSSQAS